jgi:hypothetical protein
LANPVHISILDTELYAFTDDFYGIQYHSIAFKDSVAINKLDKLDMKWVRQWAYPEQFHPEPGIWDWSELDDKINTAAGLGYEIVLCLFQSHDWFAGTPDSGWWYVDSALVEWEIAARELALRYQDRVKVFLMFDEVNYLLPDEDDYMTFKTCAELYIAAAAEIKAVNPSLLCGGPSGYGGWENGHWGNYVMAEPGGTDLLDFISVNQFITWNPDESDEDVMDHTIWYEEAPNKIRAMMGANTPEMLILDAYNVNGLWQYNGELWTDPRNTNFFGGIYHAAAKLHSAKGGYDITLHWNTLGGYGVLQWYPDYNETVPYHSWRFLIETAGIVPGTVLIDAITDETPREVSHMSGMNTDCYAVQPFAVKTTDDRINVVLINKYAENKNIVIDTPSGMNHYKLFRFDEDRILLANEMIECDNTDDTLSVTCPGMSVTVIQYGPETLTGLSGIDLPDRSQITGNYPNPFNPATAISYSITAKAPTNRQLSASDNVKLNVYDLNGRFIRTLLNEKQNSGFYTVHFDASDLPSGTYLLQLVTENCVDVSKITLMK